MIIFKRLKMKGPAMTSPTFTSEQVQQFAQDGCLIVKEMFSKEQMELLVKIAKADRKMELERDGRVDRQGAASALRLRNDLPEDIYSAVVRNQRMVTGAEQFLGEEVYHFHHKMMLKEPRVGGAWEWHQDYGYWYKNNDCLAPHMLSVMVGVDKATRENGCIQVIKGSHRYGRIEHGVVGTQTGADLERVEAIKAREEHIYVELNPGDAVYFHSNLLHCSDQNFSENPRWALVCCYNAKSNDPFKPQRPENHPNYNYLERQSDQELLDIGQKQWAAMQQDAPV